LAEISRIVVKLGTGILTDSRKQPDAAQMGQLVAQIAERQHAGQQVVVVSSGAVGAGMGVLGFNTRPRELAALQACAAVGQSRLMTQYESLFQQHGLHVAQVLLTHGDLADHDRHLNARNTLLTLLRRRIVPIINENDAVSVTELKFGDNDRLSALVACLLPADLLVILTSVDGVLRNFGDANAHVVPTVERIDPALEATAKGTTSATAVGGMTTKIDAARMAVRAGIPMVIASGRRPGVLGRVVAGEAEGTLFVPWAGKLRGRKRWIAFFHHSKGKVAVDAGAYTALSQGGKSLLLPGVSRCEGEFGAGDVISIHAPDGREFARGIAGVSAAQIRARKRTRIEAVHRDNLVLLDP
jgi:glutamate 5-kinase